MKGSRLDSNSGFWALKAMVQSPDRLRMGGGGAVLRSSNFERCGVTLTRLCKLARVVVHKVSLTLVQRPLLLPLGMIGHVGGSAYWLQRGI